MKHKRQTLSKQGEDGDDKDSTTSEGGKSGKMSDKFLDDEMSKKSCQGCEMPTGAGCGPHDDVPDLGATRGNNNNTPSATNNNTSFNSNSNGASSVASSGSFDKMMEDDSRSNEDSGVHTSPRSNKKPSTANISVKIEGRKSSPNSERRIGLCKASPGAKVESCSNGQGLLMALTDGIPSGSKGLSSRSLTPSSTPGTPMQHQSPIGPPNSALYPQLPRSSPTTATAIASATVTIQNVSNAVPPFAARGATNFQNQYPVSANHEYPTSQRPKHQNVQYQMHHQNYNSEVYNSEHHMINNHQNIMMGSRASEVTRTTGRGHIRQNYQQQQYNQHYYNYKNQNPDTAYHNMNNQTGYNHGYGYNNHYGYHHGMYPSENAESMSIGNHMNQQENYYNSEGIQNPIHKNHVEYPAKTNDGYYENNMYHMSQSNHDSYVPSEGYQQGTAVPNTATAIAAATAAVMTPPTSVPTDSGDNYGTFHQFYDAPQTQAPPVSGDNSNSSADFNFLSNLANDFAPEYYQLS